MSVLNKKIQSVKNLSIKRSVGKLYTESNNVYWKYTFSNALPNNTSIANIFRGTKYPVLRAQADVEVSDKSTFYKLSTTYDNSRLLKFNNTFVILSYDNNTYEYKAFIPGGDNTGSVDMDTTLLNRYLHYFYAVLQEDFPAPKDFELIRKSVYEIEPIHEMVLLVLIGGGCIEIMLDTNIVNDPDENDPLISNSAGTVRHRYLTENWASKYGEDIYKQYYTDVIVGDRGDFVQGDQHRNSIFSAISDVVLENTGYDHGNLSNDILDNLKVYYYTKPIQTLNNYNFNTVYSFDGAAGSIFKSGASTEIYLTNVANLMNNRDNNEAILHNVFFEFPNIEDFDNIIFTFDFSNLLYLKDENRSMTSYINNKYTGSNYADVSASVKLNGNILFDSIGLLDLRYWDIKLQKWMSTNVVNKSYYTALYSSTTETKDPLGIVRDCITEDGYTLTTLGEIDGNSYNPFFDYENSYLTVNSGENGGLDWSNVEVTLKVKDGFKKLYTHEYIAADQNTKLNYSLVAPDNIFELDDKSFNNSDIYGKKLFWLATPPIIQHIGENDSGGSPSVAQFYIDDPVFGPSELSKSLGIPLVGKYPKDIFKILKGLRIE